MLEKGPWSHSPDSVFTTSAGNDTHKEIANMASDDARMSSNDLETGKIDSVEVTSVLMILSCLTSFLTMKMICTGSSSQLAEGSQDAFKADSKLKSIQEDCSTSRPASAGDNAGLAHTPSLHIANKESESKDDSTSCEQISSQEKHSKQHKASGGKDLQRNLGPDSVNYVETDIPYMLPGYINSSDQVSICPTMSSAKSENNDHSYSKIKLSHTSNQVQSVESSHGPSFEAPSIITSKKKGKLYCQQDTQVPLNRTAKHAKMGSEMAICDPITILNQVQQDACRSEVEGVCVVNPDELDSSNARETSCVISPLDEVSLEATSFRQLQQVMEKLDIRTKLCIRDSLYRLARSAEQRHNCSKPKGGIRDDKDEDASGSSVANETSKCTGFMDMETDTNPIDRSIAHLLFHRPSDPSQRPDIDAASSKSHAMIHGSITDPLPMLSEEQVGGNGTYAAGSDKKAPTNCDGR
ncbi:Dentin sialophosphoprotein-related, putative isoform 5 [Hibiscus syriacus]|uniref:Dentin sialophosphoprotein-related, putative isoform 5 n=1 Tax=Hibiscus syriacus TaxID=106335 RepID=A0A6A3CDT5_HIBSY|nr:Dentin sialophosphoprotein-related, putative isoform 5 [Hibiscus syriacus]